MKNEKLALKEKFDKKDENLKKLILDQLLISNKISSAWLVRKAKCTFDHAREMIISVTTHSCYEWDGMEINALDLEFQTCCLCFRSHNV